MENRAFNYVCVITYPILFFAGVFDLFIAQFLMSGVIILLMFLLSGLYYFSRYKKIYQPGIIVYALLSYVTLILNYYINSGIAGPTLTLFFLTFQLLITIGKPGQFLFWIVMHVGIVTTLLLTEYLHPGWVPYTYLSTRARYFDIISNFIIAIAFIFCITNYLRSSFNKERLLAEQREQAIMQQNVLITEQNRMLEKINDEKNKLFSIISHDLRSPMDTIKGYLMLMSENMLDGEEKKKVEAELQEQTRYTSDMLFNLLSWARSQMEGVALNIVAVKAKDIIEETIRDRFAFASKKNIALSCSADDNLEALCDRDMMLIVLRNLLNNAIKFTMPGGSVFIKAVAKGDKIELSVKDTGVGISQEKHDTLFTLKAASTYGTNKEKGTGLGLMMCKEFMNYQQGDISFESKPRLGTVFYITLPLA